MPDEGGTRVRQATGPAGARWDRHERHVNGYSGSLIASAASVNSSGRHADRTPTGRELLVRARSSRRAATSAFLRVALRGVVHDVVRDECRASVRALSTSRDRTRPKGLCRVRLRSAGLGRKACGRVRQRTRVGRGRRCGRTSPRLARSPGAGRSPRTTTRRTGSRAPRSSSGPSRRGAPQRACRCASGRCEAVTCRGRRRDRGD